MTININLNKNALIGAAACVAGLLLALGPQFLFTACPQHEHDGAWSRCHWSVQAILGSGIIIAALGICMVFLSDLKTHIGLNIGIFLSAIVTLAFPYSLIGGCGSHEMRCWKVAFPAVTVISIVILAGSAAYMVYLMKKAKA
jgi:hypothetical protein